jgi:hypothetical protein
MDRLTADHERYLDEARRTLTSHSRRRADSLPRHSLTAATAATLASNLSGPGERARSSSENGHWDDIELRLR